MNGWNTSDTPRRISARRLASVCGLVAMIGGAVGLRATGASIDSLRAESLGTHVVTMLRQAAWGVASALQPEKAEQHGTIWGEFERDFGQPASGGDSQITMIQQDGDRTVEVRIIDGAITAKVNGKKVKKDRIVREGSAVRITDDDNNVLAEFHVAEPGLAATSPLLLQEFIAGRRGGLDPAPQAFALAVNPPKVMIGVTMSDADAEVAEQLGIAGGVRLDHVYDGLPADDAGLRAGDIVIEFDGEENPTTEGIRELLRSKDPGDDVGVTVLRKGKKVELSVELGEYDAAKLGQSPAGMTTIPFGAARTPGQAATAWMMHPGANEEARRAINEALKSLEGGESAQAHAALADALKRLQSAEGGAQSIWLGQGGEVFTVEPTPVEPGEGAMDQRMADLDRRLSELDARMEQLDRRLQRVLEAMERAPGRGGR